MANEDQDNAKVDPKNVVSVEYNDISEEQRQVLEAHLKEFEVEYKRMIASCYGRTWQCMVEKPMLPSKETNNVSISSPSVFDQFASILGDKINESRKFTQDLIISLTNQVQVLSKGKGVDHSNSNGTLTLVHQLRQYLHHNLYTVCRQTTLLGRHHHRHRSS